MDKEEDVYKNVFSIITLNKQLRRKTTTVGVKSSRSSLPESKGQEEEVARKTKEEIACRLVEGERKLIAEKT